MPVCADNCPEDAGKVEPGVCGCGTTDTDSDEDGTADCIGKYHHGSLYYDSLLLSWFKVAERSRFFFLLSGEAWRARV